MDRFVIKTKRKTTDEHEQSSQPLPVGEGGISRGHGGTRKKTGKERGGEKHKEHGETTAAEETSEPPQADVPGVLNLSIHSWLH